MSKNTVSMNDTKFLKMTKSIWKIWSGISRPKNFLLKKSLTEWIFVFDTIGRGSIGQTILNRSI